MENKKNKTTKILILFAAIFIAQLYLVSALTISSVTSNPAQIQPGETTTLSLNIKNDLNEEIENVIITLGLNNPASQLPFAPYQSSSSVRIDNINDGESERASFNLLAFSDAASGTYLIPVHATYNLEGNTTLIPPADLGVVSITINAKPDIQTSAQNPVLIKGMEGKITLKIVNSGLGASKFLSISLGQVTGLQITDSNNVYIGNIDSNDFDTSDFNIFVSKTAPSIINLPVEITYTDSANNKRTENQIVSLKTYTSQEAINLGLIKKNNSIWIIVLIISVVAAYLIYRKIRKRNKKNNLH